MPSYDYWNDVEKDLDRVRFQIGGRSTDIEQIGYSLRAFVKDNFPMNGVPENIVSSLTHLVVVLEEASKVYEETIDCIAEYCQKTKDAK